ILVQGAVQMSKDLVIQAGSPNAALLLCDAAPSSATTSLAFSRLANADRIPLLLWTNGDVVFLKGMSLAPVSIIGRTIHLGKDQFVGYDHAIMAPLIADFTNGTIVNGVPSPPLPTTHADLRVTQNPAQAIVRFALSRPAYSAATLTIYDATGRAVRRIEVGP